MRIHCLQGVGTILVTRELASLVCFAMLEELHEGADHVDQCGELPFIV